MDGVAARPQCLLHNGLAASQKGHKMSTVHSSIDHHPDLLALRASYERVAESTGAHFTFGLALLTGLYVAASPWIVGFSSATSLAWCDFIVGVAVAFLAYGFATAACSGCSGTEPSKGV